MLEWPDAPEANKLWGLIGFPQPLTKKTNIKEYLIKSANEGLEWTGIWTKLLSSI